MWVVPAETVQNMDVLDAPTGMYSRHVSAGTTHSAANAATYLNEVVPGRSIVQRCGILKDVPGSAIRGPGMTGTVLRLSGKQPAASHHR